MNDKRGKNMAASVRDRLLALARERGEDFQLLLTQYGLERLLYRLSQSGYRDRFILKGAMLFVLWHDQPHRPTRDVDFLAFGDSSEAGLQEIFRELCNVTVEDDGLTLMADSVHVEVIRDATEYRTHPRRSSCRICTTPVRGQNGFTIVPDQPDQASGGLSEPGILQKAEHAPVNSVNTAGNQLYRGVIQAHCPAPRLP
jgi:hypothetical protein